jgi:hypothetical protein
MHFREIEVNLELYAAFPGGLPPHREKTKGIKSDVEKGTIKIPCFQRGNKEPVLNFRDIISKPSY